MKYVTFEEIREAVLNPHISKLSVYQIMQLHVASTEEEFARLLKRFLNEMAKDENTV